MANTTGRETSRWNGTRIAPAGERPGCRVRGWRRPGSGARVWPRPSRRPRATSCWCWSRWPWARPRTRCGTRSPTPAGGDRPIIADLGRHRPPGIGTHVPGGAHRAGAHALSSHVRKASSPCGRRSGRI